MGFLDARTRRALQALLDADASTETRPLDRVAGMRSAAAALDGDAALLAAVRDAVDGGADWSEIAAAASLKPAAARWRWQGTDDEIAARHEAGRKRAARPSSVPVDLPGLSVAEAAKALGVSVQAVYLRVTRGQLRSETVVLPDGRSYKRVFPEG